MRKVGDEEEGLEWVKMQEEREQSYLDSFLEVGG